MYDNHYDNIYSATEEPHCDDYVITRLHEDEYVWGNVRRYPSGVSLPIDAEAAEAIRQGRRKHRPGLCYVEHGFDGFCPATWPHVFAAPADGYGHHRAWLGGSDGGEPTMLAVTYDAKPDPRLISIAESWWDEHKPCRQSDPAAGGMVGVGEHLRRDGYVRAYVVPDAEARARVTAGMEIAGKSFARCWSSAGVGFEELLEQQKRLWGAKARPWPICWDMSDGLGNAEHIDPDGHRSYAVWLSKLGHAGVSRSWWLLFPRHGVAIELCHGCWISWDGRQQPHCTAVPDVAEGDRLMSLFCSIPASAMTVLERALAWREGMHARQDPLPHPEVRVLRGRELYDHLAQGMQVCYSYVPEAPAGLQSKAARIKWGKANTRYCRGKVVQKSSTHVSILDSNGTTSVRLSVVEVNNRLWLPV